MSRHAATVEWDGYNWVAVPDTGGVTQARRLDQIRGRLSEVAKLMTGTDITEWELDIRYDELGEEAAEIRRLRSELDQAERELAVKTARAVRAMRANGMSLRDIGALTGVSYQRVHQLTHGQS